ncbi:MAG: alginate export family protein [Verrucomicrobiota bacterium]
MNVTKAGPTLVFLLASLLALARGQCSGSTAAIPPSATERFLTEVKNPTDWFKWGGDFRVRNEYFDSAFSLTSGDHLHEQDVLRLRGRLWTSLTPLTNVTLNARLTGESREWFEPAFVGAYKAQSGLEWRFGIVDALNLNFGNIFEQPLSLTLGRQDVLPGELGDGWLVGDGTPLDGSMTFHFDAARLKYSADSIETKFNLMYIYQNPHPGEFMPTLGDSTSYPLFEQREQGLVLYASNKTLQHVPLDGYFIYKHDARETFDIVGTRKTLGDNADIYTTGGSVTWTPTEHWLSTLEGAYQFGRKADKILGTFAPRDVDAYGGKAKLTYLFRDELNNQVSLQGELLSGDNPKTSEQDEMFDILWGRWPRWSDLAIYSYGAEVNGRLGQLSNVGRIGANWTFNPHPKLTLGTTYNAWFAPEETATRGSAALFSNDGSFRGHFAQALLKWQLNKHLNGHVLGEWVWQGDYYQQRDVMSFLRAEILYTF